MAIIHTPRSLAAIARGMLKRRRKLAALATTTTSHTGGSAGTTTPISDSASRFVGFAQMESDDSSSDNAHVYKSRPSILWDADYLGHMNNASYLTHAEYARWEWMAETGALEAMYKAGAHFVVTQSAVRFRKEIFLSQSFEIHSFLHAIDDRHLWMHQTFRSCSNKKKKSGGTSTEANEKGRIMAQVLVQAVAVQNRKVVPPSTILEAIGIPEDVVGSLLWKEDTATNNDGEEKEDELSYLQRFKELDEAFRKEATADDERLISSKGGINE